MLFRSGVFASVWSWLEKRRPRPPEDADLPEDMSVVSLVGGGLIAGDSIAALVLGVLGLVSLMG